MTDWIYIHSIYNVYTKYIHRSRQDHDAGKKEDPERAGWDH
jgi:hypothetical protein